MSKWVGYAVSVSCCEPLGCYQGTILEADGATITLTKPFRNGFPYPKAQVTLNAADIRELRIISAAATPAAPAPAAPAPRRAPRAPVCESLQPAPAHGGGGGGGAGRAARGRAGGGGGGGAARRRDEACFGAAADAPLEDDFDFEGNLALFDKRALWDEMRAQRPDVVRAATDKLRHDESVLGAPAGGGGGRSIRVPDELRAAPGYASDAGVPVPAVLPRLRRQLWEGLARAGLAGDARLLLARAAADVALRLAGGVRRLEPRNAHQAPAAVALCGARARGAAGLAAARLLASHGVRAHVHVAGEGEACAEVRRELAALALSGVSPEPLARLPRAVDVVLVALPAAGAEGALAWARGARAALVCVEPPACGYEGLAARASVCGVLPPALPAALGRLYLADVAPPARLFSDLRVDYRSPFGATTALALHPADE